MKKLICLVLVVMLALAAVSALGESYFWEEFTPFSASLAMYDMYYNSAESIYSDSYKRADFTFRIMLDLVFDTELSAGDSDYSFQWRAPSYVGLYQGEDTELIAISIVYIRSNNSNGLLICRYNPTTHDASYRILENLPVNAQIYAIYMMGQICGHDNNFENNSTDIDNAISAYEQSLGMSLGI